MMPALNSHLFLRTFPGQSAVPVEGMVGDPNPRGQNSRKSSAYKDVFSQDIAEVGRYPVNVGGIAQ